MSNWNINKFFFGQIYVLVHSIARYCALPLICYMCRVMQNMHNLTTSTHCSLEFVHKVNFTFFHDSLENQILRLAIDSSWNSNQIRLYNTYKFALSDWKKKSKTCIKGYSSSRRIFLTKTNTPTNRITSPISQTFLTNIYSGYRANPFKPQYWIP